MRVQPFIILLATTYGNAFVEPEEIDHAPLVVNTTSGQVHGKVDPALPNVRQFLSIPYAQPPLGELRFAPPQRLDTPNATINATQYPPSCMQYQSTHTNSFGQYAVPEYYINAARTTSAEDISEDCLFAAIWTPTRLSNSSDCKTCDTGLPVIIFSTGGGYQIGGINIPYQIPGPWVNRTQSHIVLSFNYRVNIFGFPNAKGLEQNNLVNLDHRMIIEWTRDNIAAFGGNPNKISLWGQSAGAATADQYTFDYPDDPIITGVMSDSGTAIGCFPTPDYQDKKNFTFVADNVGCFGLANNPAQQLACMRNVSAETINNFIANYSDNDPNPTLSFRPVIDEKLVFSSYEGRKQANIPEIQGTNLNEGTAFADFNPQGINETQALYESLGRIICFATETSRMRQQAGLKTYRYVYAGNFSNVSPLPFLAAYHSGELPILMGTHPDFNRGGSTPLEYATSFAFQDAYLAFARDPWNGLEGQNWQPYLDMGACQVREFGAGVPARDLSYADVEGMCNGTNPLSVDSLIPNGLW